MSKLKVIGSGEKFGSVFPAYADMALSKIGLHGFDEDEAFVSLAFKMVGKCMANEIPTALYDLWKGRDQTLPSYLAVIARGSERDVLLYHLYGLMMYRQMEVDAYGGFQSSSTTTRQTQNWIKMRAYLDAEGLGIPTENGDENIKKRLASLSTPTYTDPDEATIILNEDVPCAFVIENPGHMETFYTEARQTALMGIVHGRPFYFLNTPGKNPKDPEQIVFDRDEISMIHGFDRQERITPEPNESSTGEIVEGGDQKFYVCVPSIHKAKHVMIHGIPNNERQRNPTAFLTEVMGPKIREEYGRLLPHELHKEGLARCMEGDFDFLSLDLTAKSAREVREERRRESKKEFYEAEDVGMF